MGAEIIALESNPYRISKAEELGVKNVINLRDDNAMEHILDLTQGNGVDRAIDCSGSPTAHRFCIDALRRKGHLAFVGESSGETALSISRDMIRKGLELKGSWHYNMKGVYDIMRIISDNRLKINQLITHKFPIDEIQHAWETQVSGECGKVLIEPWN